MNAGEQGTDELDLLLVRRAGPDAELARALRRLSRTVAELDPVPNPSLATLLGASSPAQAVLHAVEGRSDADRRGRRTWRRLAGATPVVTALLAGSALVAAASVGAVVQHRQTAPAPPATPAPVPPAPTASSGAGTVAPSARPTDTAPAGTARHVTAPVGSPTTAAPRERVSAGVTTSPPLPTSTDRGGEAAGSGSTDGADPTVPTTEATSGSSTPTTGSETSGGSDGGGSATTTTSDADGSSASDRGSSDLSGGSSSGSGDVPGSGSDGGPPSG